MNCLRCNNEMKIAVLTGDALGTPAWLHYKKKGIFETEKRSAVDCYVCTKCGYVELKAKTPEVFSEC